jgi:predicted nucleic acid-binding protein
VAGGLVYDAVIARSIFNAGARVLLTWNVQDFLQVAPAGLEIITPVEFGRRAAPLH